MHLTFQKKGTQKILKLKTAKQGKIFENLGKKVQNLNCILKKGR